MGKEFNSLQAPVVDIFVKNLSGPHSPPQHLGFIPGLNLPQVARYFDQHCLYPGQAAFMEGTVKPSHPRILHAHGTEGYGGHGVPGRQSAHDGLEFNELVNFMLVYFALLEFHI
jgi:hypothetical protein